MQPFWALTFRWMRHQAPDRRGQRQRRQHRLHGCQGHPAAQRHGLAVLGGLMVTGLAASGCFTIKTVNPSQKTALERQLIGDLEAFSKEKLLTASVRARRGAADDPMGSLAARAIAARRRQMFNRDDIVELKGWGCVGEGLDARLVARECPQVSDPELEAVRARVVQQENRDRASIIDWSISTDPVLTPEDRAQVVAIYHRLLVEQAEPGHWIQTRQGTWTRK